nr:hypothetical protein [Treponema sp.]
TSSKTTRQTAKTTSYGYSINEAGTKTVTTDSVTPHTSAEDTAADDTQSGFTPETKSTQFVAAAATAPELSVGASWFITEKATLDISYTTVFANVALFGGNNGLFQKNLKLMFSVKF